MWALLMMGCLPKYSHLPPIEPTEIAAPATYQWVDVDGVNVAYIDVGPRDGEPLLFVHGLSSWLDFWAYQIPAFSDDYRVLALDLPGYGASDRPDAPYTMAWFADVVASFLDAKGIEHATVVGHSMGGQIGMTLALEHPERVDRLVLAAPAGFETFTVGHGEWMKAYWHESRALDAREEDSRRSFTAFVFNVRDEHTEHLLETRVRMESSDAFEGTSLAVSRSIAGMIDGPVYERLPELATPTLIVFGTHDSLIPNPIFNGGYTRSVAEKGHAALPDSELVMVPRAGHTVQHDDAPAFNEALTAWLTSHPLETP